MYSFNYNYLIIVIDFEYLIKIYDYHNNIYLYVSLDRKINQTQNQTT